MSPREHPIDHSRSEPRDLKVFWDEGFLPTGLAHSLLLVPFRGNTHEHNGFDRFVQWAERHWQRASIDEADVAALPFDGREFFRLKGSALREIRELGRRFVELAGNAGLRTLVVVNHDSSRPIPLPDTALVLRTSLDRKTRLANEFSLTATHEDIVATHFDGDVALREWSESPTVGFCGHVAASGPPLKRRLKLSVYGLLERTLGLYFPGNDGVYLRRAAIEHVEAQRRLRSNFVLRGEYFGGQTGDVYSQVRREYLDNIVGSDYVLCVRGYGNFSFRFYETMSLGRTPVLIDTNCALPYDFLHDYRELCVIVPEEDLGALGPRILEFHSKFSQGGYREHQSRLRQFWENWLSPQGYFAHVAAHWEALV